MNDSEALKQGALKAFLSHKLCESLNNQELLVTTAPFKSNDTDRLSDAWRLVLATAERYVSYCQQALRDAEKFGICSRLSYVLAALDRAESSLHWAEQAANSSGRISYRPKLHAFICFSKSAACLVNEMLARSQNDDLLASLWHVAHTICEDNVDADTCNTMLTEAELLRPFSTIKMNYQLKKADEQTVHNFMRCAEQFDRRGWACTVLCKLAEISPSLHESRHTYDRMSSVAVDVARLYRLAAEYTDRAAACTTEWKVVWDTLGESLSAKAADGAALVEEFNPEGGQWQLGSIMTAVRCSAMHALEERYQYAVEQLIREEERKHGPRSSSADVSRVQERLSAFVHTVAASPLCVKPMIATESQVQHFKKTLEDLVHFINRLATSSRIQLSRSDYFLQQAQRTDRSLSPAHEQMAECWLAAAAQATRAEEIERTVDCSGSELTDVLRAQAKRDADAARDKSARYAQLAGSLCADAASYLREAIKSAHCPDAQLAWETAAMRALRAVEHERYNIEEDFRHAAPLLQALRDDAATASYARLAKMFLRAQRDPVLLELACLVKRLRENEVRVGELRNSPLEVDAAAAYTAQRMENICATLSCLADSFSQKRGGSLPALNTVSEEKAAVLTEGADVVLQLSDLCLTACRMTGINHAEVSKCIAFARSELHKLWPHIESKLPLPKSAHAFVLSATVSVKLARAHACKDTWSLRVLPCADHQVMKAAGAEELENTRNYLLELARLLVGCADAGMHATIDAPTIAINSEECTDKDAALKTASALVNGFRCATLAAEPDMHPSLKEWYIAAATQWEAAGDHYRKVARAVRVHKHHSSNQIRFITRCAEDQRKAGEYYMLACEAWTTNPEVAKMWARAARCSAREGKIVGSKEAADREDRRAHYIAADASEWYSNAARAGLEMRADVFSAWKAAAEAAEQLVVFRLFKQGKMFVVQSKASTAAKHRVAMEMAQEARELQEAHVIEATVMQEKANTDRAAAGAGSLGELGNVRPPSPPLSSARSAGTLESVSVRSGATARARKPSAPVSSQTRKSPRRK